MYFATYFEKHLTPLRIGCNVCRSPIPYLENSPCLNARQTSRTQSATVAPSTFPFGFQRCGIDPRFKLYLHSTITCACKTPSLWASNTRTNPPKYSAYFSFKTRRLNSFHASANRRRASDKSSPATCGIVIVSSATCSFALRSIASMISGV